jgi:hypothetical protein
MEMNSARIVSAGLPAIGLPAIGLPAFAQGATAFRRARAPSAVLTKAGVSAAGATHLQAAGTSCGLAIKPSLYSRGFNVDDNVDTPQS